MRLLILSQYFAPEIGAPQTRLRAICDVLVGLGHQVEVVTSLPNYPEGRIFADYRRSVYRREVQDGISIHRVWLYAKAGRGVKRIINYASFTLSCLIGLVMARKPTYIFVESPPLTLSIPAILMARVWKVPVIFNVSDLWPDSAVDMGIMREGFFIRSARRLESWTYRNATYVTAVTCGIEQALIHDKHVPVDKILFLPNGVDICQFRPGTPDITLKKNLGLGGKKIVLYQGTLGYAHALEHVLSAARLLGEEPDIHFLFVGGGSEKPMLEKMALQLELKNVTFLPPIPLEELPSFISIAECGLVSLKNLPIFQGARPAKTLPIMASAKPVLFVGAGEGAQLVRDANAGVVVPPADSVALADAIRTIIRNPDLAEKLGRNAREYVEENLQWPRLTQDWLTELRLRGVKADASSVAIANKPSHSSAP
jgi:colanic acid biosynthesis glycosyl transferase WcaI